jgi:hypothetical protein
MMADVELGVIIIQEVEEAIVLGLADDPSDPRNYLMFQKPGRASSAKPDEIYIELNDQSSSAYGAIAEIEIRTSSIDIRLNVHGYEYVGRQCIVVGFDESRHEEVVGLFRSFFEKTGTRLVI